MDREKIYRYRFAMVFMLIAVLLVAYVPTPISFAAPPTVDWPDATFKGKAKTMDIGYGLKAKPVKFSGRSQNRPPKPRPPAPTTNKVKFRGRPQNESPIGDSVVYFSFKLTGKAKKQGIYVLELYYEGRKVLAGTDEDGWGSVSFGVTKGKVNTIAVGVVADIPYGSPIDRSKFEVKRVKFIPGYRLDVDTAFTEEKYNGLNVCINEIVAPGETNKKIRLRRSVNGKGPLHIVRKNATIRFYGYGYALGSGKIEQSGTMHMTVNVGNKKVSGKVSVKKGKSATGDIGFITDTIYPYSPFMQPKNWPMASIKIKKNAVVRIESVVFEQPNPSDSV